MNAAHVSDSLLYKAKVPKETVKYPLSIILYCYRIRRASTWDQKESKMACSAAQAWQIQRVRRRRRRCGDKEKWKSQLAPVISVAGGANAAFGSTRHRCTCRRGAFAAWRWNNGKHDAAKTPAQRHGNAVGRYLRRFPAKRTKNAEMAAFLGQLAGLPAP